MYISHPRRFRNFNNIRFPIDEIKTFDYSMDKQRLETFDETSEKNLR